MTLLKTLTRAAGLGLCVVAFAGTALAGDNGNPPATPPGQEKKAEKPAATPPAPQASNGQQQKAENEAKQAAKKAEPKPAAKADKAKSSGSYKNTSSGTDEKKGMLHKHTICHATGSSSNPYVRITPSVSGVFHGHMGHQGDEDIIPPFNYKGTWYSQNWDAAGQALFAANCAAAATSTPLKQDKAKKDKDKQDEKKTEHGNCPATTTTTERVLVGVKHYTGAVKNGQRKFVVISPSQKSAHMNGKHADDEPMYETRTVTRTVSGENCATVTSSPNPTGTANTESTVQASQSTQVGAVAGTQAPVTGVAGAVSPANANANAAAAKQDKPAGGVLGAIASAPEAVAETATSGTLPFTGIPLWIAALIGGALLATGLVLRRAT